MQSGGDSPNPFVAIRGALRSTVEEQQAAAEGKRKLSLFSKVFATKSTAEQIQSNEKLILARWGPEESVIHQMIHRYWSSQRTLEHWINTYKDDPKAFKKYLLKGYLEPIPIQWVQDQRLAWSYPEGSYWENPAEKRLYYTLNHARLADGSIHPKLYPLNIRRDRNEIIRRGNARNALQKPLDLQMIRRYGSKHDAFQDDPQIKSHHYSEQVKNTVYEARTAALHELADGLQAGMDHLEVMLLLDVSGSMTWDPHRGVNGPDGITRYHDQPPNIALVKNLVHRCLHHMIPRTQREHPYQKGIDLFSFSSHGHYHGQITANNFDQDWNRMITMGGSTRIMTGWQCVKRQFFKEQHAINSAWGRYDKTFGWQPTSGMPKLSLLVFLDGEALDMDEFELELLGETWAYVTIALVGMENCPHHHSHAIELERVCKFNPHIGFFDVHGRVCERLVVQDMLASVYPVDPPTYTEILDPLFDLPGYIESSRAEDKINPLRTK